MEADASMPKQLGDDSPEENKQKDADIAFHEESPKKENTFSDTKTSIQREGVKRSNSLSYRSARKCVSSENYKVVPISTEIENKYSVENGYQLNNYHQRLFMKGTYINTHQLQIKST